MDEFEKIKRRLDASTFLSQPGIRRLLEDAHWMREEIERLRWELYQAQHPTAEREGECEG